jgi:leader peptidase (prepilin peptidase) / N-methyltransferase
MVVIGLCILGLCFGSFTNALVWRIHEQAKPKKKRVAKDRELSITRGRSMCPQCQHLLAWYDLLPVLSWIGLRGKCRYCMRSISPQYPLVELFTALLFVVSYYNWPYALNGQGTVLFAFWLVFLVGFMALTVYDLRWMLLPDRIVFPMQGLALVYTAVRIALNGNYRSLILGAILAVVCMAGLFYTLFQVSKGKWIGGGDVKLAVVLGLLVGGPLESLLVIFLASLLGSLVSIPLLLRGKAKMRIPFGPLLIIATIIVYLFGATLLSWYKHQLLLV